MQQEKLFEAMDKTVAVMKREPKWFDLSIRQTLKKFSEGIKDEMFEQFAKESNELELFCYASKYDYIGKVYDDAFPYLVGRVYTEARLN